MLKGGKSVMSVLFKGFTYFFHGDFLFCGHNINTKIKSLSGKTFLEEEFEGNLLTIGSQKKLVFRRLDLKRGENLNLRPKVNIPKEVLSSQEIPYLESFVLIYNLCIERFWKKWDLAKILFLTDLLPKINPKNAQMLSKANEINVCLSLFLGGSSIFNGVIISSNRQKIWRSHSQYLRDYS